MADLVGARAIAEELGRLAGVAVSEWQIYRLAEQRTPIRRDRERWKLRADADALREWWTGSRLAANFAKRLKELALGLHGARMAKRASRPIMARSGKTGELRIVGIVGFEELTTSAFTDAMAALGQVATIRVLVNSDGGLVSDGLAIYHALRSSKATVEMEIVGVAASMASAIAMAGDRISMAEDALLMIHDPWSGATGNADDLRAAADMLDKFGESLAAIYARRSKYSEAQILEMMGKDGGAGTWMNAQEALAAGFIDEILAPAQARLPQSIPAAALAKRLIKGSKRGAPPMKHFVAAMLALITAVVDEKTTREDVIKQLAEAAKMKPDAAAKVVDGEELPTLTQLRGFADVLGATTKELREAIEKDGAKLKAESDPTPPAPTDPPRGQATDIAQAVAAAILEDHRRQRAIRAEAARFSIPEATTTELVGSCATVAEARERILAWLADPKNRAHIGGPARVEASEDERDKRIEGLAQWLVIKAGFARTVEAHIRQETGQGRRLDPGEFRGMRLIDIARDCIELSGGSTRGLNPMEIAKRALNLHVRAEGPQQTTSDFPILLENVLHKMLMAAYALAPAKWRSVAATGSVQDFRAHPRLRIGSIARLDTLLETGEFKALNLPDAEKQSIQAGTFGNLVGLTRQSIVNDDVDGFGRLVTMLGQAAARSVDIDLFALFALNSGLGPTLSDSHTVFFARTPTNIDTNAGAPSASTLESGRVLMAQQKDPAGQDFLDLRPAVWVGPIGLGADVRTAINAQYDFSAETSGNTGQFMKPNIVRDLVGTIVDTPRLSGTRWYLLADPMVAPVFEVVFLQGEEAPVIESEMGFDYDGVRWKIRYDYGVGATDFRGGVTNAGA